MVVVVVVLGINCLFGYGAFDRETRRSGYQDRASFYRCMVCLGFGFKLRWKRALVILDERHDLSLLL